MIKRINMLPYYAVTLGIKEEYRIEVVRSIFEHTISDLGYFIKLTTIDVRYIDHYTIRHLIEIIDDVIYNRLVGIPSDVSIEFIMLTKHRFALHINE